MKYKAVLYNDGRFTDMYMTRAVPASTSDAILYEQAWQNNQGYKFSGLTREEFLKRLSVVKTPRLINWIGSFDTDDAADLANAFKNALTI